MECRAISLNQGWACRKLPRTAWNAELPGPAFIRSADRPLPAQPSWLCGRRLATRQRLVLQKARLLGLPMVHFQGASPVADGLARAVDCYQAAALRRPGARITKRQARCVLIRPIPNRYYCDIATGHDSQRAHR